MKILYSKKTRQEIIVDDADYEALKGKTWHITKRGRYAATNVKVAPGVYRSMFLHRLLIEPPEGMVVDHINGNKLDNRRENLRVVSSAGNLASARRLNKNNSVGHRGITIARGKYHAAYRGKHICVAENLETAIAKWHEFVSTLYPEQYKAIQLSQNGRQP